MQRPPKNVDEALEWLAQGVLAVGRRHARRVEVVGHVSGVGDSGEFFQDWMVPEMNAARKYLHDLEDALAAQLTACWDCDKLATWQVFLDAEWQFYCDDHKKGRGARPFPDDYQAEYIARQVLQRLPAGEQASGA